MNKKIKGFTLAEILGVIVVIGLLLMIIVPTIVNRLKGNEKNAEEASNKIIFNAASQHIYENEDKYPLSKKYCITIKSLIEEGKLASPVKDVKTGKTVDDNYSVLVYRYLAGNMDFELMKDEECTEVASLPMIDFDVNPKGTTWKSGRDVDIIYPSDDICDQSTRTYRKDKGSWISQGSFRYNASSNRPVVHFDDPGELQARMKCKNELVESKIQLINIDNEPASVTFSPNSQPSWIKGGKAVKVTITDKAGKSISGIGPNQRVCYVWSTSGNSAPSFSGSTCLTTPNSKYTKSTSVTVPASTSSSLSGIYYLWIKGGIKDRSGNETEAERSGAFYFDNTKPNCGTWNGQSTSWTASNRTISVSCSDSHSGCTQSSYNVKTFSSGTTSTASLSYTISDNVGNTRSCSEVVNVYVDKEAPNTPSVYNPSGGNWTKSSFPLTLSSSDVHNGSGIGYYQYSYDASSWTTYSNSASTTFVTTDFSKERNQPAYLRVCDKVGNCSGSASTQIKIDKTAPTKPSVSNPTSGNWVNYNFSVGLSSSDPKNSTGTSSGIASYAYSYDASSWNTYSNSASTSFTTTPFKIERNQPAYFRVCGLVGNCSGSSSTQIRIDKTKPTLSGPYHSGISSSISATCSDSASGPVSSSISTSISWGASGTLTLTCKDKAGNSSSGSRYMSYSTCASGSNTCRGGYNRVWSSCASRTTRNCYPTKENCNVSGCTCYNNGECKCSSCVGGYVNGSWNSCLTGSNTCQAGYN